jgi:hypothetical protein
MHALELPNKSFRAHPDYHVAQTIHQSALVASRSKGITQLLTRTSPDFGQSTIRVANRLVSKTFTS